MLAVLTAAAAQHYRHVTVLAAAVLALLVFAPHASAGPGSIAYVRDWNVWVATPDGKTVRQVTSDGTSVLPYQSPSQADDGTIFAVLGTRFVHLAQNGSRIGEPLPSILTESPTAGGAGPFDLTVSPDGQKLAYWVGYVVGSYDPACNCILTSPSENVVWQRADRREVLGTTRFFEAPSWLADSSRAIVWAPLNRSAAQAAVAAIGQDANDVASWFTDFETITPGSQAENVGPGELTRDVQRLAALRVGDGQQLVIYDASAGLGTPPKGLCGLSSPAGGRYTKPTWSPDGAALAWADAQGISTSPIPSTAVMAAGDCSAFNGQVVIPGGFQPDWGPADITAVPAATPAAPEKPPSSSTGKRSPTAVSIGALAVVPPARTCVRRRGFSLRLRGRAVRARIKLTGKPTRVIKGRALRRPIRTGRLRNGKKVTLRVTTVDAAGTTRTATRTYRICSRRKP